MEHPAEERAVVAATNLVLIAVGVMLAVIGAFLVPQRLFDGVEGVSAVIALVGNAAVGILGGIGTGALLGALLPGVGWFVTLGVFSILAPGGDVIIPGRLATDPGVPTAGTAFFVLGLLGTLLAMGVTYRFIRRGGTPTPPG